MICRITQNFPAVGVEEKAEAVLAIVHEDLLCNFCFGGKHHKLPNNRVPRKALRIHQTLALPEIIWALDHLDNGADHGNRQRWSFQAVTPLIKSRSH